MVGSNLAFKLLSLNARGIRSFEKRKAVFGWLLKQKADLFFLQETYSTKEVENVWKKQWKGEMFFSHGSQHSRGVLILIKNSLEFNLHLCGLTKKGVLFFLRHLCKIKSSYLLTFTPQTN